MKYLVLTISAFDKSLPNWPELQLSFEDSKEEAIRLAARVPGGAAVLEFPDDCQPKVIPKTDLGIN